MNCRMSRVRVKQECCGLNSLVDRHRKERRSSLREPLQDGGFPKSKEERLGSTPGRQGSVAVLLLNQGISFSFQTSLRQ